MLPAGSWKLDTDDTIKTQLPRFDTQSKQGAQQAFNPPRAVYVRLSDELLQQLKAAQAGNAPFHLELASPASGSGSGMIKPNASGSSSTLKPTAVTLGDITYPLITPVNNSQSRNKTTELLERVSSSSISKVSSSSQSNSLKVCSSNCTEHYDVGPSTSSRYSGGAAAAMSTSTAAAKEKTAENMGERIRERAAQMAKEKESRKIVLMDDDAFPGVKGKKGKTTAKAQSNLLRASAITAKRSASPAGMPARQSPSLGPTSTTSRPPNRLLANEAAKGLMKKSNLHPPQPTSGGNSETKATSPGSDTSSHMEVAVTPTMSTGAVLAASPQHTPSTAVSSLSAIDSKTANKAAAAPIQGSPARRQFHQMKVDTDDLASASSDSEDEDDAPLAVRITSPVKTHFTAEAVVETQERAAQSQAKATPKTIQRHDRAYSSVNFAAKGKVVSDSASSASEGSASDREAARPQPSAVPSAAMKRLSPESAPSSRASSPGRAAGGPRTMAKTSGGSRLSRPVSKVSPRTSPKAAPVEAAIPALAPSETSSIEASTSSASTRRLPSPLPTVSNSDSMQIDKPAVQESLSVEQDLRPTSRAPSPHPSPRSHPLPAKPPVSPSHIKSHTSLHPPSSKASPPPPAVRQAEQDKSPQQPRPSLPSLGLPANPITGVMPNIPKSPSSLHPPSHSYSHTVSAAPSAHSTPGASPIVSHFPSPSRGSRSPNAGPLRTTTNGKRKDGPKEEANAASMSDKSAITKKKKLNDGTASSLSASTGSEEDGEAEEEEGEYKAEPAEPVIADKASSTTKALQDSALARNEAPKGVPSKPAISKSGLPSFTKKGRMSELKGRDASTPQPRSQSASRANTPISYGSMEVDAVTSSTSSPYKAKVTGSLRIASDAEFAKRSLEFQDKLYPEYTRLYSKLEDLKASLSKGKRGSQISKASNISPKQISRMVDEVNERSRELERIKVGLWQYSDEKKRREGSSRNPQGMARVK